MQTSIGDHIIKFDAAGNLLWMARYNTILGGYPSDLAIDNAGKIYVTGSAGTVKYTEEPVPSTSLSVKLGSDGQLELGLLGEAGRFYSLQVSDDLRTWSLLTSFAITSESVHLLRVGVQPVGQRFFRAIKDP